MTDEAHSLDANVVIANLQTDEDRGLSEKEANARLMRYGANVLETPKRVSITKIIARQFKNVLIIILLFATLASVFLGEAIDAIVILMIVAFVVILGVYQEQRTEKTLHALKKMQSHHSTVLRDGETNRINTRDLVPGDIVVLSSGDKISADMRLLETFNLKVDESSLTGESVPVEKGADVLPVDVPISDRINIAFCGTSVMTGKGKAVITSTGMRTEFGKIAKEAIEQGFRKEPATGFERSMGEIGEKLGTILVILIALIVVGALIEQLFIFHQNLEPDMMVSILLFGIALAVAAVPEALPAILTGSLAIAAHQMSERNALPKNLSVVETLGITQIVCADKTGTITKGEMTVKELYLSALKLEVTGAGYDPKGKVILSDEELQDPSISESLRELAMAAILCNDAALTQQKDGKWIVNGDPTEGALVVLAQKIGFAYKKTRSSSPRLWEIPFTSESKRMTTVNLVDERRKIAYMKGALESVLECCEFARTSGNLVELNNKARQDIQEIFDSMANKSLRVLALAMKDISNLSSQDKEIGRQNDDNILRKGFLFLGLVGMIDPPRPEAIEAILKAKGAGIETVMITGDHKATAVAIARETGIYKEGDLVLTGIDIDRTSDSELDEKVERVKVYARVSPMHKLRIVSSWMRKSKIVAMTGDGVNDAPALEKADVGISMGITGTEVAKEASDLILLDDNFATIIKAIELGRGIRGNIRKYLAYLLSANLVEVCVLGMGVLLIPLIIGISPSSSLDSFLPLLAVQLLYINLATDGLPALALGLSPPEPGIMDSPLGIKGSVSSIFDSEVKKFIIATILVQSPLLLLAYATALPIGIEEARTRLFLTFVLSELILALNCSSLEHPVEKVRPYQWLLISVFWESFILVLLVWMPATRAALHLALPSNLDLVWVFSSCFAVFITIDMVKRLGPNVEVKSRS